MVIADYADVTTIFWVILRQPIELHELLEYGWVEIIGFRFRTGGNNVPNSIGEAREERAIVAKCRLLPGEYSSFAHVSSSIQSGFYRISRV